MKTIKIILILIFVCTCICSKVNGQILVTDGGIDDFVPPADILLNSSNEWVDLHLNGKVRQMKFQYYDAEISLDKVIDSVASDSYRLIEFNTKGYIIDYRTLSRNDEIISISTYKYDDNNRLIEVNTIVYWPQLLKTKSIYSYDKGSNEIKRVTKDDKGNIRGTTIYKLDDKGNIGKVSYYHGDGVLYQYFTHKYDSNNYLYERVSYIDNSIFKQELKYNDKHQAVECIETTNIKVLDPYTKYICIYDQMSNIIERSFIGQSGVLSSTRSYEYKYDKYGNWQRQLHFINGNLDKLYATRKFVYF